MADLGGKPVAAISGQPEQQRDAGAPPAWNSYITVESADETLAKATQLGATVHAPAFDVLDVGRMGVVQDPQSAYFCVWEPKRHIGAGLVNAPGALSWDELASPDLDGSQQFYEQLFGWRIEPFGPSSEMEYRAIKNAAGWNIGGLRRVMPPGTPPSGQPPARHPASPERAAPESSGWLVYFGIDDADAGLAKAEQLGATKLTDAMDIGMGKIAVVLDPQGAVFALYAGQFEP
jgi:predicted enzyme related to lactoylglutathione lyase